MWLLATVWVAFLPRVYQPSGFAVPLYPVWPSVGVLLCLLLIGTLGPPTWIRWAITLVAGLGIYLAWFTISNMLDAPSAAKRRGSEEDGNAVDVVATTLPPMRA